MKAFKQLISLLYQDPRHWSWCLAVQAVIGLVPAAWGIFNEGGTDRGKFGCLRTQCGRSRSSWTWAHSGLEATRSAWWSWCVWESSVLILAGVAAPFPHLASPKVCISGFAETTCSLVTLASASQSGFQDQILKHEEKGSAQSWSLAICAGKTVQFYLHLLKETPVFKCPALVTLN